MLSTPRFLLSFAAPYRFQLVIVGALTLASSLVMLAVPWLAGHAISGVIVASGSATAWLVALLLGALVTIALLNFAIAYVSGKTATRLLADLRLMIYEHLQRLPLEFHERGRLGDVLALMTNEIGFLSDFLMSTLASTPSRIITVIGAMVLMIRIDPALALLAPILFPIYYVILRLIGRRLRSLARQRQQAEAEMVGIAEENLQMLAAIKAFAREDHEAQRYASRIDRASNLIWQERKIQAALQPTLSLIS
ncbi:MAG: ABC transporter transmembrane domain-containing protein, partial [Novosphingobium sp.]